MPTRLRIYLGLVLTAAGAFLLLGVDWRELWELSFSDYLGLGVFAGLAVLSEHLAVHTGRGQKVRSSIAFLPLLAMALVFPVSAVVLGAIGTHTAAPPLAKNWRHFAFNLSQAVLAYGMASTAFETLVSEPGFQDVFSLFIPFYVAALTVFGTNILLISGFIAIRDKQRILPVIADATAKTGGNLFYDILASPVALGVAALYWNFYIPGVLFVVFPLMLVRFTYLSVLQLDKANNDLLEVLIKAIETRDPYTSGHSRRVATLARLVAEDHGLRASAVARAEKAALLHDIGKIDALYADVISKAGALSEEEFALIKTHAVQGAELLLSLSSLEKEIIDGVRHHHEMYDGSGYPDGLQGRAIPLPARIIMLCDSIDAMLSDRPYRNALPVASVKAELERCSGSQFDPELIATVLNKGTLERAELLVERYGATAKVRVVS